MERLQSAPLNGKQFAKLVGKETSIKSVCQSDRTSYLRQFSTASASWSYSLYKQEIRTAHMKVYHLAGGTREELLMNGLCWIVKLKIHEVFFLVYMVLAQNVNKLQRSSHFAQTFFQEPSNFVESEEEVFHSLSRCKLWTSKLLSKISCTVFL